MCVMYVTPLRYLCGDVESDFVTYEFCGLSDGWDTCCDTRVEVCPVSVLDMVCDRCLYSWQQGKRGRDSSGDEDESPQRKRGKR